MAINTTFDAALSAYIEAAAAALSLPIPPEHQHAVVEQFVRLAAMADLVAEHSLEITDEPAPTFHSGTRT